MVYPAVLMRCGQVWMCQLRAEEGLGARGDLRLLDPALPPQAHRQVLLPSLRLFPARGAKAPGLDSKLSSEGSRGRTRFQLPLALEAQRANPDSTTFLTSLRVCRTRRPSQVPAFLTRPETTENDMGALSHHEGAVWAHRGQYLHGTPRRRSSGLPLRPSNRLR